jgi:hypothetical protein
MIGHHRGLLIGGQVNPDDRVPGGTSTLSRASRALRLRSPLDKPVRSITDVLLDALGYQARQPHQEDVFTSSTDALRGVTSGSPVCSSQCDGPGHVAGDRAGRLNWTARYNSGIVA